MRTTRSDAWCDSSDSALAMTVLKHIRNGSTQLKAFEEVGETIGRTAAACGFRWNSFVRKKYADAIKKAKAERKNYKQGIDFFTDTTEKKQDFIDFNNIYSCLETMMSLFKNRQTRLDEVNKELETLNNKILALKSERERLLSLGSSDQSALNFDKEDYQAFLSIVQHASRLMLQESVPVVQHEKTG